MPDPIRIALIGAGIYMRETHAPAFRLLNEQYEIAAIYSRTHESAARLAAAFDHQPTVTTDIDDLLKREDIQAFDIALPIDQMPAIIEAALRAGKHVISEKPAAPDLAVGRQLLAVADQYPQQAWFVAENWRFEPTFLQARDLINQGAIGKPMFISWVISIRMDETNPYYHTTWRRTPGYQGGFLFDVGVHHSAALRLVVGEVVQVSAVTAQMRQDLPPADTLSASLVFRDGMIGNYACTFAPPSSLPPYLVVFGSEGLLRVDRPHIEIIRGQDTERRQLWDTQPRPIVTILREFSAAVHSDVPSRHSTGQEALRDLAVMEAIFQSAASGQSQFVESI